MAEENEQEKQTGSPEEQATGEQEPKKKTSPGRRISVAFSDIYGLVKKKKPDDQKPAPGGETKPAKEKSKTVTLPAALNPQKINLKTVNQVLVLALIILVGLMFFVTFREGPDILSVTEAVSKIKFLDVKTKEIAAFQEVAAYLDQIKTRDIFRAWEEKKPEPPPAEVKKDLPPPPPPAPKVPIEEKAKNFKLIGISWGNNPKAMIRDISTQEVHFMSEGEKLKDTDLTIEKVMKEEVILSSEGEEMSML